MQTPYYECSRYLGTFYTVDFQRTEDQESPYIQNKGPGFESVYIRDVSLESTKHYPGA
jgi:hypothetical protein